VLEAIGRVRSAERIGDTVVAMRGDRPVLVRDVADLCREGGAFKRGEGSRNGKPAVIVGVQKQPGANTIQVTPASGRGTRSPAAGTAARHDDRIGASSARPISSKSPSTT
jgi:Cu/Ag efflux pump CusA